MNDSALPFGVENMYTEIGQVINGKDAARINLTEKVIACNTGVLASDIGIGALIYDLILEKEIGIDLPLIVKASIL